MSSPLFSQIQQSISDIIAKYKVAASDGKVTLAEAVQLVMDFSREVVKVTESLPAVGSEKKAAALEALELFIDHVVTPLDLAFIPNWVEPIVDRQLKSLFLAIADGAIESSVSLFKQIGWK